MSGIGKAGWMILTLRGELPDTVLGKVLRVGGFLGQSDADSADEQRSRNA